MLAFKTGKVAAVISGCRLEVVEHNLIFPNKSYLINCTAKWQRLSGGAVASFDGEHDIAFIPPGTYRFKSFSGNFEDRDYSYYTQNKDSLFLTDFSVNGGDVVYIGNLFIDTTGTKQLLHSLTPVYYKGSVIKNWLGNNYLGLVHKLKNKDIAFNGRAKIARKWFPMLDN